MHFRILNRLEVIPDGGVPLAISPIKRRALCALLLAGEQGLSPGELMEAVWGDGYARDGSLKTCLSQLRRVLPGLRGPPVIDVLDGGSHVAVLAVAPARSIYRTIAQLRQLGGEGILVTRIERLMP